jgi:3-oxoacyl-[acyl-carrier protein] reductase
MSILSGRVAVVTGGSRGIGAAIVRRLCADGATVAFSYANSEHRALALAEELEAAGHQVLPIHADSADTSAVQRMIDTVVRSEGPIDILVNNAGILAPGTIDAVSLADFDRIMAVNVRGYFVAIHAAVPHMKAGGRIINIGSVVSDRIGRAGSALYGMSKAAVAGLTRGLAHDLGPRGITINNVQPGPTETEIVQDEAIRAQLRGMIPLGRMGQDSEIAGFVSFLAGPDSGFVNGASLTVDGGYNA